MVCFVWGFGVILVVMDFGGRILLFVYVLLLRSCLKFFEVFVIIFCNCLGVLLSWKSVCGNGELF